MGYTCNKKRPYRAEVTLSEKYKEKMGETASICKKELQIQIERLIQLLIEQSGYSHPQISVRIYHNEELFLTHKRTA